MTKFHYLILIKIEHKYIDTCDLESKIFIYKHDEDKCQL